VIDSRPHAENTDSAPYGNNGAFPALGAGLAGPDISHPDRKRLGAISTPHLCKTRNQSGNAERWQPTQWMHRGVP